MARRRFGHEVAENRDRFFSGREEELAQFRRHLGADDGMPVIFNLHGLGGMGKSSLLNQFQRIAAEEGVFFLKIDSKDFSHTPEGFAKFFARSLGYPGPGAGAAGPEEVLAEGIARLAARAPDRRAVLAFDTYEDMHSMDRWLRENLIPGLPKTVTVIISGRTPLEKLWRPYPHWRRLVKPIAVAEFSPAEAERLARARGLGERHTHQLYAITGGHPLSMALMLEGGPGPNLRGEPGGEPAWTGRLRENLEHIVQRWLREIENPKIRRMAEVAAIVRNFEQDLLETALGEDISRDDFRRFVSLSFVGKTGSGWNLHDLVQKHMAKELRLRKPARFKVLWERSIFYYYRRLLHAAPGDRKSRSELIEDLFFVLGDTLIRMVFFADRGAGRFFGEQADESHTEEIENFLGMLLRRFRQLDVEVKYVDGGGSGEYTLSMPAEYFRKETALLRKEDLTALGPEAFHFIRDEDGEPAGIIVNVPINNETMEYLGTSPVSAAYFNGLTAKERENYAVAAPARSGCFLRLIGFKDDDDPAARAALMYYLLSLWLREPRSIVTTGFPLYIEMLERIGFTRVPDTTHYEYGPNFPAPTFILDLRNDYLITFIDSIVARAGATGSAFLLNERFQLTPREREVAHLVAECLSNAEIARELGVAEITIKKHLTNIFEKTGVKNRLELMRKIYAPV